MERNKLKVLLLTNIPSPYMLEYLTELGKKCELTVLFERAKASDRGNDWDEFKFKNFKGIILNGIKFGEENALCFKALKYIKKGVYDFIIVANPMSPTGILSIFKMRRKKIPFAIQSEGGFCKTGKGLKEKFKKFIISSASFYLSGMGGIKEDYFLMYGNKNSPIYDYPFASMHKSSIKKQALTREEKLKIREEVGISGEKMIISVGRFLKIKGMDVLMKACSNFQKNVALVIIGGTPPTEYIELANCCNIKNIKFLPFLQPELLLKYISSADLFVLATRTDTWGLVINEAMSQGVPVITTENCVAGKKLIADGENGYIVPVDDDKTLRERIDKILFDDEKLNGMAKKSLDIIQRYNYEDMASSIFDALMKEKDKNNSKNEQQG